MFPRIIQILYVFVTVSKSSSVVSRDSAARRPTAYDIETPISATYCFGGRTWGKMTYTYFHFFINNIMFYSWENISSLWGCISLKVYSINNYMKKATPHSGKYVFTFHFYLFILLTLMTWFSRFNIVPINLLYFLLP